MAEMDLHIGADVYFRDGRGGKLIKVVVDPASKRVTHLIVEKGFLQKEDRVLPVTLVERATPEAIYLSIESKELAHYPKYREMEFVQPAPDWEYNRYRQGEVVHWATYYGLVTVEPIVPYVRYKVHEGVPATQEVIGRGTPVRTLDGVVGKIDHVLVNRETGEITHLVLRRGVFPQRLVIPISLVTEVDDEGVFLDITNEELKELPHYTPRAAVDILEDLRQRFAASKHDFRDVKAQVVDQVVHLSGVVKDVEAKREAEEIARSVPGVVDVENRLDTDTAIMARVVAALAEDPRTSTAVIEVVSDRGVVTLSGTVDSMEIREAAQEIAAKQPGVVAVINALEVRPREPEWHIPVVSAPLQQH